MIIVHVNLHFTLLASVWNVRVWWNCSFILLHWYICVDTACPLSARVTGYSRHLVTNVTVAYCTWIFYSHFVLSCVSPRAFHFQMNSSRTSLHSITTVFAWTEMVSGSKHVCSKSPLLIPHPIEALCENEINVGRLSLAIIQFNTTDNVGSTALSD